MMWSELCFFTLVTCRSQNESRNYTDHFTLRQQTIHLIYSRGIHQTNTGGSSIKRRIDID